MLVDHEILLRHVNRLYTMLCSGKYFTATDIYNSDYLCTTANEVCNNETIFLLRLFAPNEQPPVDFELCETNDLAAKYCEQFAEKFGVTLVYNENFLLPVFEAVFE